MRLGRQRFVRRRTTALCMATIVTIVVTVCTNGTPKATWTAVASTDPSSVISQDETAFFTDDPSITTPVYPGVSYGPLAERYLNPTETSCDTSSHCGTFVAATPPGFNDNNCCAPPADLTYRWTDPSASTPDSNKFSYDIPAPSGWAAGQTLYLSLIGSAEIEMDVGPYGAQQTLLNSIAATGRHGDTPWTPYEVVVPESLVDTSLGAGHAQVHVTFRDPDPTNGWGPRINVLRLGTQSLWQERVRRVEWDTTSIVWRFGHMDGSSAEFAGLGNPNAPISVPLDGSNPPSPTLLAQASPTGRVTLRWTAVTPNLNRHYVLLFGVSGRLPYRNISGNSIDWYRYVVGSDQIFLNSNGSGSPALSAPTGGYEIHMLDVTDYLKGGGTTATFTAPVNVPWTSGQTASAQFDFFALVETARSNQPIALARPNSLRVTFGGSELADNFSKIVNTSMWAGLNIQQQDGQSGFVDASPLTGEFPNAYAPSDTAAAENELMGWGFVDRVQETIDWQIASGHENDISVDALIRLIKAHGLSDASTTYYYNVLRTILNPPNLPSYSSTLHLYGCPPGTSCREGGEGYPLSLNLSLYDEFRAAAALAAELGANSDESAWTQQAVDVASGINGPLTMSTTTAPETYTEGDDPQSFNNVQLGAGTFAYSIDSTGAPYTHVNAGWFDAGFLKDTWMGFSNDDPTVRQRVNATLDWAINHFWSQNWPLYGDNRGLGTHYAAISDRGGSTTLAFLEGDRMGDAEKNLEHVVFNSTDTNFAPAGRNTASESTAGYLGNSGEFAEISPYAMVREITPDDQGVILTVSYRKVGGYAAASATGTCASVARQVMRSARAGMR